jgi:hypothetical protein
MAKGDANAQDGPAIAQGFWGSLTRATFGGSIVTHMTWIVLGGVAGVGWVANSSYADGKVKVLGMWLVTGLAVAGLGTLIWTSVSPLANVLGKDIPGALRAVQEKGRGTRVEPDRLRATPPSTGSRRREKGTNV